MQAKERAGQERAVGAQGFAAGRFSLELYRRFLYLRMEQDTFLQTFKSYATKAEDAVYRRIVAGPSVSAVNGLRAIADAGGLQGDLNGVDGAAWFRTATARIDLMRAVEIAFAERTLLSAAKNSEAAKIGFWILLGAAGGVTVLVSAIAMITVRSLARPLLTLTVAMTALAGGDTTVDVPASDRADQVGAMARAWPCCVTTGCSPTGYRRENVRSKRCGSVATPKWKPTLSLSAWRLLTHCTGWTLLAMPCSAPPVDSQAQPLK